MYVYTLCMRVCVWEGGGVSSVCGCGCGCGCGCVGVCVDMAGAELSAVGQAARAVVPSPPHASALCCHFGSVRCLRVGRACSMVVVVAVVVAVVVVVVVVTVAVAVAVATPAMGMLRRLSRTHCTWLRVPAAAVVTIVPVAVAVVPAAVSARVRV